MTGCHGRPARCLLALGIGVLLAAAPPRASAGSLAAAAAAPIGAQAQARVDSDRLAEVSIDTTGGLTIAEGALPPDMWRDTPRSLVESLLPRLPVATSSPATRALMRRLLLSAAALPPGEGEQGRLLEERAWQLWRMSDADGLFRLVAAVPADARSSRLMRLDTEMQLLTGDIDGACRTAQTQIADDPDVFWQMVLGFCQALRGAADETALTLALLAERDVDLGSYKALLGVVSGTGSAAVPRLPDPTPLDLAMLRAAGKSPQPDAADTAELPMLAAIARSEMFAEPLRLAAAERAVAAGVSPAEQLLALYARAPTARPAPVTARGAVRAELTTPPSPAAIARGALESGDGNRTEAAARALEAGRQTGRWLQAVRLVTPWLAAAEPDASPAVARQVVPAMLVLGDRARAEAWLGMLADQAAGSTEADDTLGALLPLARLARLPQAQSWNADDLLEWWQREQGRPDGRIRVERAATLLLATGDKTPDALWLALLQGPAQSKATGIDPAYRLQILRAARGRRLGETVLLALVASGLDGPDMLATSSLEVVVESLRTVGLQADARAFALEGAAAR